MVTGKSRFFGQLSPINQSGVGIFEALVAAGLISIAVVGLMNLVHMLAEARARVKLITGAIVLESNLVSGLSDPRNYSIYLLNFMKAGLTQGTATPLGSAGKSVSATFRVSFPLASPGFYIDMPAVGGDVVVAGRWRVKVDMARLSAGVNAVSNWGFAYHVAPVKIRPDAPSQYFQITSGPQPNYDPNFVDVIPGIRAFGVRSESFNVGSYGSTDYKIQAPYLEFNSSNTSGTSTCDLFNTLGMRGYDPQNNLAICLNRPEPKCGPHEYVVGLRSVAGEVYWQCSQPMRRQHCSHPLYTMWSLDPNALFKQVGEQFPATGGACVFIGQDQATYSQSFTGPGRVFGTVCPYGYKIDTSNPGLVCKFGTITQKDGQCVKYTYTTKEYEYYDPTFGYNVKRRVPIATAEYTVQPPTPPLENRPELSEYRDPGSGLNVVDCKVIVPPQKCGAYWHAEAILTPICVLDQTIYPSLKAADVHE